jgi:hypothetical protein
VRPAAVRLAAVRLAARHGDERARRAADLGAEAAPQHVLLATHRDRREVAVVGAEAERAAVAALERAHAPLVDEHRLEGVERLVAGGAVDRPLGAQPLLADEDLLDEHRHVPAGRRASSAARSRRR